MKQSAETEAGRKFQYENGTRPNPGQGLRINNDYIEGCYHCRILVRLFGCIGASPYDKGQMMRAIDWLQMGPGAWLCPRCKDDPMARASAPQRSGRAPLAQGFLPVDGNGNFAGFPPGFGGKAQNDQQPGVPQQVPGAPQPQQFAPPQQQPQQLQPGAPPAGYPQPQGAPQQPPQQFQQPGAPPPGGYAPPPQGYPQQPQQPGYPQQQPGYPPQQQFAPAPQPPQYAQPPQQQPQYAPPQMQAPYPPQQQQPPQGYAPQQAPMAYAPQPPQQQAFARAPYASPPRRARNDWRSHAGNPVGQAAPQPPRHVNLVANPVEGQEPDLARARAIASGDPNAPQPALPSGTAPTLPAADPSQSSAPPQE